MIGYNKANTDGNLNVIRVLSIKIRGGIMSPEQYPSITRECRTCLKTKSLEDFPITRGKRFFCCIACCAIKGQRWADANRERVREHKKAYETKYPERVKESKRKWSRENEDLQRWKSRVERVENREERNRLARERYKEDPAPFLTRCLRRKIRDAQAGGSYTEDDQYALFERQGGLCANPYCHVDLREVGFHADHIIPVVRGGSHDVANRQLLCTVCNHRKSTMTNEEWHARQTPDDADMWKQLREAEQNIVRRNTK